MQFKIQDLPLKDHIKVDSTSWTICKSMINFMHNNVFNQYISRCGSYVGH
jgi:hypothetical protein